MRSKTIRPLILASALLLAAPLAVPAAAEPIEIEWGDLIPRAAPNPIEEMQSRLGLTEEDGSLSTPRGVIQHGQLGTVAGGADVVTDYNGETVTLSGYVIPLDYTANGIESFMLVPFVGACIHVPPPPPNQLVFVITETPFMVRGLFEPFTVTGEFGTATTTTDLAQVGYFMKADEVAPYQ